LLIGLADGHVSYVTTPEEYDAQFYEGAQNIYGAATGPLIQTKLVALTEEANTQESSKLAAQSYEYEPGVCRVFLPRDAGLPTFSSDDGLQNILMDLEQPMLTKRDFPQQCWIDAIPKLSRIPDGGCARSVPYVWIEKQNTSHPEDQCTAMFQATAADFLERPCDIPHPDACGPGDPRLCIGAVPQDNCGLDLVTVLNGTYMDRTRWCAFWMPPESTLVPEEHRICVAGVTNQNVVQMDALYDESRRDELLMTPLDRGAEANWLQRLVVGHMECCGQSTRPVCEWPLPAPAAGP